MNENMEKKIGYALSELLPIVQRLTEKYTSMESSSVTYDKAKQLMNAVIYCICEGMSDSNTGLSTRTKISASVLYQEGYQRVLEKTREAKDIYNQLIEKFNDYGCRNYRDTIRKGMPSFFLMYDAMFAPQDHLLLLDYPLAEADRKESEGLCGVNLILYYLKSISREQIFLSKFNPEAIKQMLRNIQPEYEELYFDNICDPIMDGYF